MLLRRAFGRNKVEVLFDLCLRCFSIHLKRCELPLTHFTLELRPEFQHILIAPNFGINHLTSGRYDEGEAKLVKTRVHTAKRNDTAMRFDFMVAGDFVVVGGPWLLFLLLREAGADK